MLRREPRTAGGDGIIGPRISNADFFDSLDLTRPELASVRVAAATADWAAARRAFAEHLRSRTEPRWFGDWANRAGPRMTDVEFKLPSSSSPPAAELHRADRIASSILESCAVEHDFGDSIDWELNPIEYREWTWQLSRHEFWVTLGRAYWQTSEEKYASAFVRQMRHWIRYVLVPADSDGNTWIEDARMGTNQTNCWRTIECGIRLGQTWPAAFYYFLSSPTFSDDDVCLMVKSMVEQTRHLDRWPRSGNWQTMQANGQYHVGVLFPEFAEASDWRETAIHSLYDELDRQVYPDGAQFELSSLYHHVSLRNFLMAYSLAELNNEPVPAGYLAKLERMYHYDLYAAMPNFRLPAVNDGDQMDVRPYLAEGYTLFPERTDFLWAATNGAEGDQPRELSHAFPWAGHYVMRTGWEESESYLLFDGGPLGYAHQHEDKLSIVVYALGKVHVVDPGNYPYDQSKWRRYVISTRAHNTAIVDGLEQNRRDSAGTEHVVKEPLPHRWVTDQRFDIASASYSLGYGPQRNRSVTHTRTIVFVKPRYWILTDFFVPKDHYRHTYEILFHLNAGAARIGNAGESVVTANPPGESNLSIHAAGTERHCVRVISGQENPVVQGWIPGGGPYSCVPIPTAVFKTVGTGPVAMTFILYPVRPGDSSPVESLEIDASQAETVGIQGRMAFVNRGDVKFLVTLSGRVIIEADVTDEIVDVVASSSENDDGKDGRESAKGE